MFFYCRVSTMTKTFYIFCGLLKTRDDAHMFALHHTTNSKKSV